MILTYFSKKLLLVLSGFLALSGQLICMNDGIGNDQEWDLCVKDLLQTYNELENKFSLARAAVLGYITRNNFHKKLNFLEKREQLKQLLPNNTIDYKIDFKKLTPPHKLDCGETERAKCAVERAVRLYNTNGTPIDLNILVPRKHGCKQCLDYNCWIVLYFTQYHRPLLKNLIDRGLEIGQFNDSALFDTGRFEVCMRNYRNFFYWDYWKSINNNNNITNLSRAIEHYNSVIAVLEGNYNSIGDWLLAAEIFLYVGPGAWKNFEKENFNSLEEALIWYFTKIGLLTYYENYPGYTQAHTIKLNNKLFNAYVKNYKKDFLELCKEYSKNPVLGGRKNLDLFIQCADVFEHKEILTHLQNIKDRSDFRSTLFNLQNQTRYIDLMFA